MNKEVTSTEGATTSVEIDEKGKKGRIYTLHGLARSPLYLVWRNMKTRCYNKNNAGFKWYGAKGITVCDEWLNAPKVFAEWAIDNGWREDLTIDRIDSKGNYEPSNCRFITKSENTKRSNERRWGKKCTTI